MAIQVKMTGQLFVVPAGAPRDRHVHLAIDLEDGRQIRLRDMRKFARVGLYRRDETGRVFRDETDSERGTDVFAHHGPEPLAADFSLARFRSRLRARRGRLKPLLLDQSFVAGVGNIYADEALWRARLHPLRTVATLRPDDERRLYRELLDVLREARRAARQLGRRLHGARRRRRDAGPPAGLSANRAAVHAVRPAYAADHGRASAARTSAPGVSASRRPIVPGLRPC